MPKHFTEQIADPNSAIGKRVKKGSNKPFKSGEKINTVKGITDHPTLHIPCFTFHEDESMVEVRRCELVKTT
jgi:hypothetical protein